MASVVRVFALLAFLLTATTSALCVWAAYVGGSTTMSSIVVVVTSPLMTWIAFRRAAAIGAVPARTPEP